MTAKYEPVLRESFLELHVNAALAGQDLGPFERVENGYQARCRRCGQTAWVGENGVQYSLLGQACSGMIPRDSEG
jgi:hypothetical protein